MGKFAALGLTADQLLEPLPEMSAQAMLARDCWLWCEGWAPERWPMFEAFHPVPDWGALAELMRAIRDQSRSAK